MDPEKKSLNFIFPTKYGIPKSLKPVSHWLSKSLSNRKPSMLLKMVASFTQLPGSMLDYPHVCAVRSINLY